MYGADVAALDAAAVEFDRAADELDRSAQVLTAALGAFSWLGSVAVRFSDLWNSIHRPGVSTTSQCLREAASAIRNNAEQQRVASSSVGAPAPIGSHGPRPASGPPALAESETSSEVNTKSGAVVAGADGSVIRLRKLSDGSVEVQVEMSTGMTADLGDAKELWEIGHGKFISEGGVAWDLDVGVEATQTRSFVFSNADDAQRFYDALYERQHKFINMTVGGGLSQSDLMDVARQTDESMTGTVTWSGSRGGNHFTGSGEIGVDIGQTGQQTGARVAVSDLHGYTSDTLASDGSTGSLSVVSGSASVTGNVTAGPLSIDGGGQVGYERQVHLVSDAAGNPVRLEVTTTWSGGLAGGGGATFLGTGASADVVSGSHLTDLLTFDLSDPSVAAAFQGTDHSTGALVEFAQQHSQMGSQSVATYSDSGVNSDWSLLFSAKGEDNSMSSSLTGQAFRPANSATFTNS